jgi:hypothetical protein
MARSSRLRLTRRSWSRCGVKEPPTHPIPTFSALPCSALLCLPSVYPHPKLALHPHCWLNSNPSSSAALVPTAATCSMAELANRRQTPSRPWTQPLAAVPWLPPACRATTAPTAPTCCRGQTWTGRGMPSQMSRGGRLLNALSGGACAGSMGLMQPGRECSGPHHWTWGGVSFDKDSTSRRASWKECLCCVGAIPTWQACGGGMLDPTAAALPACPPSSDGPPPTTWPKLAKGPPCSSVAADWSLASCQHGRPALYGHRTPACRLCAVCRSMDHAQYVVCGLRKRNVGALLNHGCDPNVFVQVAQELNSK